MGVFVLSLGFVFKLIVQLIQIAALMYETWRRREERVLHPSIGHFTPIPLYKHEYPSKGSKKTSNIYDSIVASPKDTLPRKIDISHW